MTQIIMAAVQLHSSWIGT